VNRWESIRSRQLGAESKILEGIFVKHPMDDQAGVFLFKVDAVIARPVAIEGAIGAAHRAKSVGMTGEKIGSQHVKLAQHLDLQGGGELADLRRAGGGEDDLKGRHARKLKFKFSFK